VQHAKKSLAFFTPLLLIAFAAATEQAKPSLAEQAHFSADDESVQRPGSVPEGVLQILRRDRDVLNVLKCEHLPRRTIACVVVPCVRDSSGWPQRNRYDRNSCRSFDWRECDDVLGLSPDSARIRTSFAGCYSRPIDQETQITRLSGHPGPETDCHRIRLDPLPVRWQAVPAL
jgi:hypothetical protein